MEVFYEIFMENKHQWNFFLALASTQEKRKSVEKFSVSCFVLCFQQFNLLSLWIKCCFLLSRHVVCFEYLYISPAETAWDGKCGMLIFFLLPSAFFLLKSSNNDNKWYIYKKKAFLKQRQRRRRRWKRKKWMRESLVWKFSGSESRDSKGCSLSSIPKNFSFLSSFFHLQLRAGISRKAFVNWYAFFGLLEDPVYHCVKVL